MFFNKKCAKCGKQASHKFVRIDGAQIYDMYFCQAHASENSPYQKPEMPLQEILQNLLSKTQAAPAKTGAAVDPNLRCNTCGLAFESYRKTLMLGCADCYESFFEQIVPDLRKFHGNSRHTGRKPGGGKETAPERILPPARPEAPLEIEPIEKPAAKEPGKSSPAAELRAALRRARKRMAQSIRDEDFEKAAHCRDQIKTLEEQLAERQPKP